MSPADALTSGFQRALLASSIFLLAAAVALRITDTRGEEQQQPGTEAQPEIARLPGESEDRRKSEALA